MPRKGIEHSIALVAGLNNPKCKLVVSHESGDEGHDYMVALRDMAEQEHVDLRFLSTRVGELRTLNELGQRTYTLADAYSQSDFITYPSLYEGFGNALLEAFYYRKPVLVNRYSIFVSDIEPRGARVTSMNGYVTRNVVAQVRRVIEDETYRREIVDHNFELGKTFFSYTVLRRQAPRTDHEFHGCRRPVKPDRYRYDGVEPGASPKEDQGDGRERGDLEPGDLDPGDHGPMARAVSGDCTVRRPTVGFRNFWSD